MTIAARESALLRTPVQVSGSLPTADAGRTIQLEMLGKRTHWTWQPETQTVVQRNGSYSASWTATHAGKFEIRAVVGQTGARVASELPTITVIVYRPAVATLYGPGFYGKRTACGTILGPWTLGVANRTLPCGTRVALYYQGRMLVVPVIDRGPYANGADWDLTMATGEVLGMYTTATIGAVPVRVAH
jgi:peptidoglycan lytic transglycosylase